MNLVKTKGVCMKVYFLPLLIALQGISVAHASPLTESSPNGGALPSSVSVVGGVVADLIGINGVRVVSQLAASGLFSGDTTTSVTIGSQTGFQASSFGGGLASASFRITLFDGDTAADDFDFNDNNLVVDGVNLGNTSLIATSVTNGTGGGASSAVGFPDGRLATGCFRLARGLLEHCLVRCQTVRWPMFGKS
jgi:hypothetical protein